jgi:hypothetical protein
MLQHIINSLFHDLISLLPPRSTIIRSTNPGLCLGIPLLAKPRLRRTNAMISRLWKAHDAMIASTYGIGYRAVVAKRRLLGDPGYGGK